MSVALTEVYAITSFSLSYLLENTGVVYFATDKEEKQSEEKRFQEQESKPESQGNVSQDACRRPCRFYQQSV